MKGYQARCVSSGGKHAGTSHHSPVNVKHLAAGVHYECQVRAKAKAGYGHWSGKHSV